MTLSRRSVFTLTIILPAMMVLFACGIKKPPEPPEKLFPFKVKDYFIRVRDNCAELKWTYDGKNPPEKFRIQRIEQAIDAGAFSSEQAFEMAGNENFFKDCSLKQGFLYGYQMSGISRAGFAGEPSKTIWVNVPRIPPTPENFQAVPGDKFVDLSWSADPDFGYNLYRSDTPEQFPEKPIHPGTLKQTKYSDIGLDNGKKYYYCVRAVILQKDYPAIESRCAEQSATPVDLIAPSTPRGLVAVVSGKAVVLRWFQNPEPDLLGYMVYRRRPGGTWEKLTPEPIKEREYLDKQAFRLKGAFEYAVSAVDNAPRRNQSRLSHPEPISIP